MGNFKNLGRAIEKDSTDIWPSLVYTQYMKTPWTHTYLHLRTHTCIQTQIILETTSLEGNYSFCKYLRFHGLSDTTLSLGQHYIRSTVSAFKKLEGETTAISWRLSKGGVRTECREKMPNPVLSDKQWESRFIP